MQKFQQFLPRLSKMANGFVSAKRTFAEAAAVQQPKAEAPSSGTKELKLTFASPTKAFYANTVVKQIDVPGMATNMGILPIHVPTIAVLKPGILTVYEVEGNLSKFFVSSGSLSMNIDGSCQILAEEIAALDDLDNQAAQQLLTEANQKASAAATDVEKAEALIEAEVAEAVMKAA